MQILVCVNTPTVDVALPSAIVKIQLCCSQQYVRFCCTVDWETTFKGEHICKGEVQEVGGRGGNTMPRQSNMTGKRNVMSVPGFDRVHSRKPQAGSMHQLNLMLEMGIPSYVILAVHPNPSQFLPRAQSWIWLFNCDSFNVDL